MIAVANSELEEVLARVANWPAGDRVALAVRILQTVKDVPASRGFSAEEVIARLNIPQPAPDDAECQRILDEERLRKYR